MARKRTFTATIDGVEWTLNRHGVVAGEEPDRYLPGVTVLRFPDTATRDKVRQLAVENGHEFEHYCRCPARF